VGDAKYGSSRDPLRRLALHARALVFAHPLTGSVLRFETPVPPEFLRLFDRPEAGEEMRGGRRRA
jgi:23S rRNA pseudouridine1911/1915/1917 synthase